LIQSLVPKKYIKQNEEIHEETITFSGLLDESQKIMGGHIVENGVSHHL
jgi:hypothetical protein